MRLSTLRITAAVSVLVPVTAAQDSETPYRFNGPSVDIQINGEGYEWDLGDTEEPELLEFQVAIEEETYFGPSGTFETPFNVRVANNALEPADFESGNLQLTGNKEFHCFVSYHLLNLDITDAQSTAAVNFFLEGGDLLLVNSTSSRDEIAEKLFVPTLVTPAGNSNLEGGKFAFEGVFGSANSVDPSGTPGQLSEADVLATNGIPFAYNTEGQLIGAIWAEGTYLNNPSTGAMVILTDRDIAANGKAEYTVGNTNANGRFMLNTLAALLGASRATSAVNGCGFNPPNSLQLLSGPPRIGTELVMSVNNPYNTQGPGSFSGLLLATQPHGFHPSCGTSLPGAGMLFPGSGGEVLVSLVPPNPFAVIQGETWNDQSEPAEVALPIPLNLELLDISIFAQGFIYDPDFTSGIGLGLARSIELVFGL